MNSILKMLFEQKERLHLTELKSWDVVLKCEDQQVFTHRVVLAAISGFFRNIFKVTDTDEDVITILLKDFSSLEISPILDFIYGRCENLRNCAVIENLYLDLLNPAASKPHSTSLKNQNVCNSPEQKFDPNFEDTKKDDSKHLNNFDIIDDHHFLDDLFEDEEVKLEPEVCAEDQIQNEKPAKKRRKVATRNFKKEKLKRKKSDSIEEEFELPKADPETGDLQCQLCHSYFKDEKTYRRHVYNVHAPRKVFKCDECDFTATKDPGKLRIHVAKCHGGEMLKCNLCDYQTPILKYLNKHKNKMHQGISYQCDQCDHKTSHKQLLQQHIKVKHEGFKLSCDQCLYTTGDPGALKKHRLNKHEGVVFPCDECDYVANAVNNLNRHKRAKHQEAEFLCDRCDYKTGDKGCLKEHQQIKHEGLLFRCEECDYSTKARSSLRVHKETVHLGITHPCDDCEYVAKTRKDLRYHRARKHDEAKYKCELCDYGVAAISLLNQHIMFKHEGKKIHCNMCPYFATSHQAVNKHKIKKHTLPV